MHAFLAPSGAGQWGPGRCSGAPSLQRQFPQETGEEALEGEVAHHAAASAIEGGETPVGWSHPNGRTYTAAMGEDCSPYVDACRSDMAAATAEGGVYGVEAHLHAHYSISDQCEGTPDFFAVFPIARLIRLRDLKYGHGYVDAFENGQLFVYLVAIMDTLGLTLDAGWTLEAFIHQPRNYHPEGPVRRWTLNGEGLVRRLPAWREAAQEALGNPVCRTGSWCRYCTAAHACVTLQEDASFARGHAGKAALHVQEGLALGRELSANKRALAVLKARQEGLEAQALAMASQGQRVAGWRGGYRDGRTTWSVAKERVFVWCDLLGVNARKTDTLTPKQVAALGVEARHLETITHTPTTYVLEEVNQHTIAKGLS